jgi:hypothetical protein
MAELYRSAEFVYARVLLSDEVAHASLKAVGAWGRGQLVDLTLKRHGLAAPPNEQHQYYRKRVAQATYFEKKLENFLTLFEQFGLDTPCQKSAAPRSAPASPCLLVCKFI